MQWFGKIGRGLVLLGCLAAATVWAAMPDPVEFAWAVERSDYARVKNWLDEGLDPEFQGGQIGTGLMIAAWHGNIPMMALFVERGANPRRANRNGEQPLQLAAWNNHAEAVKWLLDRGAALNRDGNYWGALHYAIFNGHLDLARYLISRGAEVNAKSPNGSTPLIIAAREGREEIVKDLLESGADPKARNDWGDTALTMAMRYDHYRLGKMISSPEEFAIAAKAPKESFGTPIRSAVVPSEIEEWLTKIREAEAAGLPTDELRRKLMLAIESFRRSAVNVNTTRRPMPLPYQPKSIVITAKRGNPGAEKAQVVVDGQAVNNTATAKTAGKSAPGSILITSGKPRPTASQVADLMRQIRLAESQGQPTDDLRKQLYDTVEAMKQ